LFNDMHVFHDATMFNYIGHILSKYMIYDYYYYHLFHLIHAS